MWAGYGEDEFGARFREAEVACERAQENPTYSKHLGHVTRLVQEVSANLEDWEA